MKQIQKKTGYPSIDKPWMKYYSEEALYGEIPKCTMFKRSKGSILYNISK